MLTSLVRLVINGYFDGDLEASSTNVADQGS